MQLNNSGFCFRIMQDKCVQAAVIVNLNENDELEWAIFNPSYGAILWVERREQFHRPKEEWLEVLDTLPLYMNDDHRYLLDIVSD